MKQLSIFDDAFQKIKKECGDGIRSYWKLFIDGAARNNPGPAGAGFYLLKDDQPVEKQGFFIGSKTNNQAEYFALLFGLFFLKKHLCKGDLVLIISDSQLLVRQLQGQYRVKNVELKPMHRLAKDFLQDVSHNVVHVLREENVQADALANLGIDKKRKPPTEFLNVLRDYEIPI